MDFDEYQESALEYDVTKNAATALQGLVGEIGDIHSAFKKRLLGGGSYPGFNDELTEELGDTLWYLTSLATRNKISMREVAEKNLAKARSFFVDGGVQNFDSEFPDDEKLPRQFEVELKEKEIGKSVQVKMYMNDVIIGDLLTDNAYDPDGYRYHDAFHLAYAAILGWSPVVRRILKRKRKSKPRIDEVEDGARAAVVEEAISILVFDYARQVTFLSNAENIGFGLLKTVKQLTQRLEVSVCPTKQWEKAILSGYKMFRELKKNKGGRLSIDMDEQEITYSNFVK